MISSFVNLSVRPNNICSGRFSMDFSPHDPFAPCSMFVRFDNLNLIRSDSFRAFRGSKRIETRRETYPRWIATDSTRPIDIDARSTPILIILVFTFPDIKLSV